VNNDKKLTKLIQELKITKKENSSSGKYSIVEKLSNPSKSYILKSNDKSFPLLGEIEFLEKSPISPKLIDFSVENNWILMEFIEGRIYDRNDDSIPIEYFTQLGKAVSKLHNIHNKGYKTYYNNPKGETYDSYIELLKDFILTNLSKLKFLNFLHFSTDDINAILDSVNQLKPSPPTLTHGDLHPGNTIINSDGMFLIDPSAERFMDFRWDYAMLKWQIRNNKNYEIYIKAFKISYDKKLEDTSKDQISADLFVSLMLEASNYNSNGQEPWAEEYIRSLLNKI
jgi:tRNA A-37 threonylcarbamoyl transferase component Bud32